MQIEEIAKKINNAGGRLYRVGGMVRDNFLGKNAEDEDFCVVSLEKDEFIKLFDNAKPRGKSFEVFDLEGKEFALARKEIKTGKGHNEFKIITGKNITIEEDLKRRDITINSIAQDVLTGKIIDPYNGINDIKNKIIRATSKSFKEDPLRVYRVARIAAQLEFDVEPSTIRMMTRLKEELDTLSKERVFAEFKKALEADKPSIFFDILKKARVLDVHFKEINDLIGAKQPEKYHPEGDAYKHTMLTLDNSAKITKDLKIRFSTLVHDIGKGKTPKEEYPHHRNHTEHGVEPLRELSKRIGVPNEWKKCGITSVLEHMRGGNFILMTPAKKVSFLERVDKSLLGLNGLQIVVFSDRCRDKYTENVKQNTFNFATLGKKMIKEIDGKYISEKYNIKAGAQFGRKLHQERVEWVKKHI